MAWGDSVAEFLAKHRTSARWLDDIINVSRWTSMTATAHVREIARKGFCQFQPKGHQHHRKDNYKTHKRLLQ